MKDADPPVKIWWVSLLKNQEKLTKEAIDTVISLIFEKENDNVRHTASRILHCQESKEETINLLVAEMAKSPSVIIQSLIAFAISSLNLSSATIDGLVSQMVDTVDEFSYPAIMALANCKNLPETAIDALSRRITTETELDKRLEASKLYRKQTLLSERGLDAMVGLITKTGPAYTREAVLHAIRYCPLSD
ncbi:hypothetical protein N7488_004040 [Penicillium malachiteum]|nr:hypothetical protein N7488_004040 [Penicillium malachiteum]